MTKQDFKIIKGGAAEEAATYLNNKTIFVSAFVTDTRLMGVLALGIHWKAILAEGPEDYHQFFYFDAEEYGLDTYERLIGDDLLTLERIEQGLIGGLGGRKVQISRREAIYLLQSFVSDSKKLKVSLPEPVAEYEALLKEPVLLSPGEKEEIIGKICTPILSDYHLIHYFLMRTFALDWEGASYLISSDLKLHELTKNKAATLYRNTIEKHIDGNGSLSYMCEAVVDLDGSYELVVLEITVFERKVTSATRRSSFRISAAEAAMMLNRSEFVSVYEILSEPAAFNEHFIPMRSTSMQTNHDNGRLFMEFNKDNSHVNKRVFSLNEDVYGLYYVSDYGQLVIAAYSLSDIHSIEKSLQKSSLNVLLLPTAKYEFKEPIVYDFIQSSYEDFEDFILSMQ